MHCGGGRRFYFWLLASGSWLLLVSQYFYDLAKLPMVPRGYMR
jgi:hypothetical protein